MAKMKFDKLLKKLKTYLNADAEKLRKKDEGLSRVLKKLKKKERNLKVKIVAEAGSEERELLEQELNVVHSQRKKGIELLSSLRKESKGK
ncbi:MAG: hypothetical protein CO187_06060 [Zetaproteobacteria bacterium CG_4_9_14_3_um_filter_53_7]|nr:MAG: hypothetical protein CO187_06060 [Zetaproteobacteria bacterium CG_4_9_14_3_um_filter_53_7]